MQKQQISNTDIIIILTITILATISTLPYFTLNVIIKDVFSIILLFIPGYSMLTAFSPLNRYGIIKKVIYSFMISISILFCLVILQNFLKSSLTVIRPNLIIILSVITLIFVTVAYYRRRRYENSLPDYSKVVICNKCKRYYELEKGEKLDDFESCTCGGSLSYYNYASKPLKTDENHEMEDKKLLIREVSSSRQLPGDLIIIFIVSISSLIFLLTPHLKESPIIVILSLPFLLFLPGYSLTRAFFPKRGDIERLERLILSFGLSILIAPTIGLILNYTWLGIKLIPLIIILSIFTILISIAAYIIRWKLPEKDRYIFNT